ncbi:MAG: hypothetical protein M3247_07125 [Thermoproteota archaeon]|nr:hypothetical protein [Thermoproteota archaeon]
MKYKAEIQEGEEASSSEIDPLSILLYGMKATIAREKYPWRHSISNKGPCP